MPAKPARKRDAPDAQQQEDRPLQEALECGAVSQERVPASVARVPGSLIHRADGLDIVKKASTRKGRCLMVFSCHLSLLPGGELGELTGMDSECPTLYMSFPCGRLKFMGAVLHPRNKYMVLKMGSKQNVLCEHVFEHMIVFHTAIWVGMASDNPTEEPLPIPAEIKKPPEDADKDNLKLDFSRGLGVPSGEQHEKRQGSSVGEGSQAKPQRMQPVRASREKVTRVVDSSEDDGGDSGAYSEHDDDDTSGSGTGGHSDSGADGHCGNDFVSDGTGVSPDGTGVSCDGNKQRADTPIEAPPQGGRGGTGSAKKQASRRGGRGRSQARTSAAIAARAAKESQPGTDVTPEKRKRTAGQQSAPASTDLAPTANPAAAQTAARSAKRGRLKAVAAVASSGSDDAGHKTPVVTPKSERMLSKAPAKAAPKTPTRETAGNSEAAEVRASGGAGPSQRRTPRRASAKVVYAAECMSEEDASLGDSSGPESGGASEAADGSDSDYGA